MLELEQRQGRKGQEKDGVQELSQQRKGMAYHGLRREKSVGEPIGSGKRYDDFLY